MQETKEMWSSIPGSGRSPGEGNSNSLQYSCLENSMGRGAWRVTVLGVMKSQTQMAEHTHAPISQVSKIRLARGHMTRKWKKTTNGKIGKELKREKLRPFLTNVGRWPFPLGLLLQLRTLLWRGPSSSLLWNVLISFHSLFTWEAF